MQPEENKVPTGDTPVEPTEANNQTAQADNMGVENAGDKPEVVSNISERLSQQTEKEVEKDETLPQANEPMLVDLANLSNEQLQSLKAMLNVTPDRAQQKKGNIRVTVRKVVKDEKDRYIVDFKQARTAIDFEPETGREFESHKIAVKLNGDSEYQDMMYNDFMDLPRVQVEVLSQREVVNMREEGEVTQAETGRLVMKETREVTYFYTLALPNGEQVEVEGKLVNA
jgi:hypothetical protein